MKENNIPTDKIGIRIDSGDLAYLSKEARKMLAEGGYPEAKICLSNGLSAEIIEALIKQGATFDSLGVGDNISKPNGRMGCVYKEVAMKKEGKWIPKIKLSNDTIKIINPFYKKLYRAYDNKSGYALADIMAKYDQVLDKDNLLIISPQDRLKNTILEDFNLIELQKEIFVDGKLVYNDPSLAEKKLYCEKEMRCLYSEIKRELNPHEYRVSGTKEYVEARENLINDIKNQIYKRGE
jgi:nicotinate phosphoribosyltransferase